MNDVYDAAIRHRLTTRLDRRAFGGSGHDPVYCAIRGCHSVTPAARDAAYAMIEGVEKDRVKQADATNRETVERVEDRDFGADIDDERMRTSVYDRHPGKKMRQVSALSCLGCFASGGAAVAVGAVWVIGRAYGLW